MPSEPRRGAIVTTSWDDGHPHDVKVAELLAKYGLKGTFYIPVKNDEHEVMSDNEVLDITSEFEVGGHTLNHVVLTTLPYTDACKEIECGKKKMEDLIGKELIIFAYPKGHYNQQVKEFVKEAGFKGARTASWFHVGYPDDLYSIHPTIHVYPHPALVHIGHLIKELNLGVLLKYLLNDRCVTDIKYLTAIWLDKIISEGGILHIWGHSWEIEELGLWGELEGILGYISQYKGLNHFTNGEIISRMRQLNK